MTTRDLKRELNVYNSIVTVDVTLWVFKMKQYINSVLTKEVSGTCDIRTWQILSFS